MVVGHSAAVKPEDQPGENLVDDVPGIAVDHTNPKDDAEDVAEPNEPA
jgi:hypothetical protein